MFGCRISPCPVWPQPKTSPLSLVKSTCSQQSAPTSRETDTCLILGSLGTSRTSEGCMHLGLAKGYVIWGTEPQKSTSPVSVTRKELQSPQAALVRNFCCGIRSSLRGNATEVSSYSKLPTEGTRP